MSIARAITSGVSAACALAVNGPDMLARPAKTGAASKNALRVAGATPLDRTVFIIPFFMFASLVDRTAALGCGRLVL
jgi:hypothetical protein